MDAVFKLDKAVFNYRVAGVWIVNGHVLLQGHSHDNLWALPGGRAKIGEQSQESLKREFYEEVGWHVKVDRLAWITENFFEYDERNFHEIGMYYIVSSNDNNFEFQHEHFHGEEGERLIFNWTPIVELENVELRPSFLRSAIKNIPATIEHIVIIEGA